MSRLNVGTQLCEPMEHSFWSGIKKHLTEMALSVTTV